MITVEIPGSVWLDFLDPACSGMEEELGLLPLRAAPFVKRRGKGSTYFYRNVPHEIVLELSEYLYDRGDTLLGQGIVDPYDPMEKAMRDMLRRAVRIGEQLRGVASAMVKS